MKRFHIDMLSFIAKKKKLEDKTEHCPSCKEVRDVKYQEFKWYGKIIRSDVCTHCGYVEDMWKYLGE
jgi:C4-type Zn-finger protein